jgi:hypothetical protein
MRAPARILITATTLATLTMLGLAATATASVPTPPRGQQHPTTVEPRTVPQVGHGAQLYHDAHDPGPATANQSSTDATTSADYAFAPSIPALAVTLVVLLVGVAGAAWVRRRHRPPAAA